ncbi:uncharacterized protein LOC142225196 [Haematobia irritans]|uniref:uncharacterized protein LOC142225196 n=1 Tax=Haematobia irritans TaxID=7368 RepID=UPI003F509F0F
MTLHFKLKQSKVENLKNNIRWILKLLGFLGEIFCGRLTLKNITCKSLDPEFCKVDVCELAPDKNRFPAVSVFVKLLQVPVTNAKMRIQLGVASATRTPKIDNTWDGCAFMKSRKTNRALNRLFGYIEPYTNLNHTCPYNHDIYVKNITLSNQRPLLPLMNNLYMVKIEFEVDGKKRITITSLFEYKN